MKKKLHISCILSFLLAGVFISSNFLNYLSQQSHYHLQSSSGYTSFQLPNDKNPSGRNHSYIIVKRDYQGSFVNSESVRHSFKKDHSSNDIDLVGIIGYFRLKAYTSYISLLKHSVTPDFRFQYLFLRKLLI